ncbi:unnamed protein product [Notodromas monacha]|uniref:CCHC-type domain-containing protein n=1 Tax=Notodromas monacha TaxID=399045 RepID=A0A7R9G9N9_9CRUS|nr:unnamed protein product [Notodromas monacha]CAG0913411.1 unnamed protein product [Notodromas monacha]
MTRWARSATSKASNRRVPEDGTPWEKLQAQSTSREAVSGDESKGSDSIESDDPKKEEELAARKREVERKKFFFEGSWVTAETKSSLIELRKASEEIPNETAKLKIESEIRLLRRREEKTTKRLKRKLCFRCRSGDHQLADCPETELNTALLDSAGSLIRGVSSGICFRCGSDKHIAKHCNGKVSAKKGKYPFATCFICTEKGHISSECPKNTKGIYLNGGSCRLCGSVLHLRKECPGLKRTEYDIARPKRMAGPSVPTKPKRVVQF